MGSPLRRSPPQPGCPMGQQAPPARLRSSLREAAQVPPVDYRDNLQRKIGHFQSRLLRSQMAVSCTATWQTFTPPLTGCETGCGPLWKAATRRISATPKTCELRSNRDRAGSRQ